MLLMILMMTKLSELFTKTNLKKQNKKNLELKKLIKKTSDKLHVK